MNETEDWRERARAAEAERKASLIRIAMGPVIGAVLIANLLTAAIVAGVWFLATH